MYFIVIQQPMKNTTICTNSVALMFIMEPRYVSTGPSQGKAAALTASLIRKT